MMQRQCLDKYPFCCSQGGYVLDLFLCKLFAVDIAGAAQGLGRGIPSVVPPSRAARVCTHWLLFASGSPGRFIDYFCFSSQESVVLYMLRGLCYGKDRKGTLMHFSSPPHFPFRGPPWRMWIEFLKDLSHRHWQCWARYFMLLSEGWQGHRSFWRRWSPYRQHTRSPDPFRVVFPLACCCHHNSWYFGQGKYQSPWWEIVEIIKYQ